MRSCKTALLIIGLCALSARILHAEVLIRISKDEQVDHAVLADGRVYFSAASGLYVADTQSCDPPRPVAWPGLDVQGQVQGETGPAHPPIETLVALPSGKVWAGTRRAGIYAIEGVRAVRRLDLNIDSGLTVFAIEPYSDTSSAFWVGTSKGLYYVDEDETATFVCIGSNSSGADNCLEGPVFALEKDNASRLWIAIRGGILAVDDRRPKDASTHDPRILANINLDASSVVDKLIASSGKVWAVTLDASHQMPTYSGGFLLETDGIKPLFPSDPNVMTLAVAEVMGQTWLGTNKGIYSYRADGHRQVEGFYGAVNALAAVGNQVWIGTDWSLFHGQATPVQDGFGAIRLVPVGDAVGDSTENTSNIAALWPVNGDLKSLDIRSRGFLVARSEEAEPQLWIASRTGLYFLERNINLTVRSSHSGLDGLAWTRNIEVESSYEGISSLGCRLSARSRKVLVETSEKAFTQDLDDFAFSGQSSYRLPGWFGRRDLVMIATDEYKNLSKRTSESMLLIEPLTPILIPTSLILAVWLIGNLALPLVAWKFPRAGRVLSRDISVFKVKLSNRLLLSKPLLYRRFFDKYISKSRRIYPEIMAGESVSLGLLNVLEGCPRVLVVGGSDSDIKWQLQVVMGRLLHSKTGPGVSIAKKSVPLLIRINKAFSFDSFSDVICKQIADNTGYEPGAADTLLRCGRFVFFVYGPGLYSGCADAIREFAARYGDRNYVLLGADRELELGQDFKVVKLESYGVEQGLRYSIKKQIEESKVKIEQFLRDRGEEDRVTLASKNNLAETLRATGKLEEARDLQQEVVEVSQRILGADHPDTLISKLNLAETLRSLGDFESAAMLDKEVSSSRVQRSGDEDRALNEFDIELDLSVSKERALNFFAAFGDAVAQKGGRLSIGRLTVGEV